MTRRQWLPLALIAAVTGLVAGLAGSRLPARAARPALMGAVAPTIDPAQIQPSTAYGRSLLGLANAAADRTSLGLGTAATAATGDFAAASHSHTFASLTSKPTTLSGYGITDAAPLASPTFTGTPAAPTASGGTNTTQLATTAFVTSAIAAVPTGGFDESASVFVDPAGNDGTGLRLRRDKPFATLAAALTAASAGDSIAVRGTTSLGAGVTVTKSVTIVGTGRPRFNSATTPTALSGGTILQGTLCVRASGVRIANLGIDVGSTFCTAQGGGYSGGADGLFCDDVSGAVSDISLTNVAVLLKTPTVAFHGFRFEGDVSKVDVTGLRMWGGVHGLTLKCRSVIARDVWGQSNGQDCIIIKADSGQTVTDVTVRDAVATDMESGGAAIVIQLAGGTLDRVSVDGIKAVACTGVYIIGGGNAGHATLLNVVSTGDRGGVIDGRPYPPTGTFDSLSIAHVRTSGAGVAGVQLGFGLQKARVHDVVETGGLWGALNYCKVAVYSQCDFASGFNVWGGDGLTGVSYVPKVFAPAGGNIFRTAPSGEAIIRTDGP